MLCLNTVSRKWESVLHPVYCKKYLKKINFQNKIQRFSVQSLQDLVLEFKIRVTPDTRKLRVNLHDHDDGNNREVCCLFLGCWMSQQHAISPSHSTLTLGQTVLAQTRQHHEPGRAASHQSTCCVTLSWWSNGWQRTNAQTEVCTCTGTSHDHLDWPRLSYREQFKDGRRRGRQRKWWEANIKEWTGLEWNIILRKAENCEEWRKLVVKSTVVPRRSARLWDR